MDKDPSTAGKEVTGDDDAPAADGDRTPEQVREEIEQTRAELGDTVAALAEKTDVKAQAHQAVDDVKASVTGKVSSIQGSVSDRAQTFAASAQEATPDSAKDAGQRAWRLIQANAAPIAVALAVGVWIGRRR